MTFNNNSNDENKIVVKPKSVAELAKMYEMTPRTLKKWLVPHEGIIGEKIGRYFSVNQVAVIFKCLGMPNKVFTDDK
jgi:hypothetical protein